MKGGVVARATLVFALVGLAGCGGNHRRSGPPPHSGSLSAAAVEGGETALGRVLRASSALRGISVEVTADGSFEATTARSVAIDLVPRNIRRSALETFPGATIQDVGVQDHTDRGRVYGVVVRTAVENTCEVWFLEDGSLLREQCGVPVDSLPEATRRSVEVAIPGVTIHAVESLRYRDGREETWVTALRDGRDHRVILDETGRVLRHLVWVPGRFGIPAETERRPDAESVR